MIAGGDESSPQDIMRELEQSLGLNPDAEPVWGYEEPNQQLFPEEAPTIEQRKLAADCLGQLFCLVEENKAPGLRRLSLQPEELIAATEHYRTEAQEQWASSVPFPDFSVEHLFSAIKRQMAWVKEVREFEETEEYNGALQIYRTIRNLLEQALHDDYPANE